MASKAINKLRRVLLGESAAVTLMFAAIFPSLVLFYSLAFDGANVNSRRARLMDSVNQGVLGVALTDNRNLTEAHKKANKTLLGAWTRYYLPGVTVPDEALSIEVSEKKDGKGNVVSVDYTASAQAQVKMALSGANDVGMGPVVALTADSGAGVIRKNIRSIATPTDFIFVTDFSGSMKKYGRIEMVKKIVAEFASMALVTNNIGNTMAIVPYSVGTPEILSRDNLMGGKETGCSFVGKLTDAYRVDLDFWFNKKVGSTRVLKTAAYNADKNLSDKYYNNIVMKNITKGAWSDLISRGWCIKNKKGGSGQGRYDYSCEAEPSLSMFSQNNDAGVTYKKEFEDNYLKAMDLMSMASTHSNIINTKTLDIEATLAGDYLFSDAAITTFRYLYSAERPFTKMCNGGLSSYSAGDYKSVTRPNYYPIALTSDPSAFTVFQSMTPLGDTDSANGLLRSVPVAAKGKNTRKVIILLTDGQDSGNSTTGPLALRNLLVEDNNLCGVIKEGLLKYPKGTLTTKVEMYYFSLVDDTDRMAFWANNCVGSGNAIVAKNYNSLLAQLTAIANKGQVQFINKDEADN